MVKIGPPSPKVNTLDVDEQSTYANTSKETWQVIKFFLEELKPVDSENLEPEDRKCYICTEDFTTDFHSAVMLPCNHVFGEKCIKTWLRPYAPCMPISYKDWRVPAANTCPICRRVFFPQQRTVDILPVMQTRIMLWDRAYALVGIALSETERRAREDLLRYLNTYFARGLDDYFPYFASIEHRSFALDQFRMYCVQLKYRNLTPVQESLRQNLEEVARGGFPGKSKRAPNYVHEFSFQIKAREAMQDSESRQDAEAEEESVELAEGDTETMRFFRALFQ